MKKTLSAILALITATTMLASCGKKEQAGTINMVDGKYVPTEELPITIWYTQGTDFAGGNKLDDNVVAQWVYDKTLVKISLMIMDT